MAGDCVDRNRSSNTHDVGRKSEWIHGICQGSFIHLQMENVPHLIGF